MKVSTPRFAQLLRDAQAWDSRYQAMCHAQQGWLLDNFVFGDQRRTEAENKIGRAVRLIPPQTTFYFLDAPFPRGIADFTT